MDISADFEKLFDSKFAENEPGGVVLVRKDGNDVFLKAYGLEDLETRRKNGPESIFNTGSISKTVVAYGILILEEEGKLSAEDPLSKYFSDLEVPEIAEKVRIKHLLTHTSGLPDLRKVEEEFEFYLTAKDAENFEPLKKTRQLDFEPGSRFRYSNPAFNGLALIIEKVSGVKWQKFITERIFKLADMNHSLITDGPFPETGVTHGYDEAHGVFTELDYGEEPTFAAAGNGGVWSTVRDLAKYEDAIRQGIFLSRENLENSRQVQRFSVWEEENEPEVGYSWFLAEKDSENNDFGVKVVSHTGWQGGFRGFFVTVPEKNIQYIGLFNRPVPGLSETFNPFSDPEKNRSDIRVEGLRILQKNNWLE